MVFLHLIQLLILRLAPLSHSKALAPSDGIIKTCTDWIWDPQLDLLRARCEDRKQHPVFAEFKLSGCLANNDGAVQVSVYLISRGRGLPFVVHWKARREKRVSNIRTVRHKSAVHIL
jgi:hypothetical protein